MSFSQALDDSKKEMLQLHTEANFAFAKVVNQARKESNFYLTLDDIKSLQEKVRKQDHDSESHFQIVCNFLGCSAIHRKKEILEALEETSSNKIELFEEMEKLTLQLKRIANYGEDQVKRLVPSMKVLRSFL